MSQSWKFFLIRSHVASARRGYLALLRVAVNCGISLQKLRLVPMSWSVGEFAFNRKANPADFLGGLRAVSPVFRDSGRVPSGAC